MNNRVEPATVIICKGMAVFLLVVALGVAHVEREINDLTRRQDFVQVFNIRRSPLADYSVYFLGASLDGRAGIAVGHIETDTHALKLRMGGQAVLIPTAASISMEQAAKMWRTWSGQFLSEADRTYSVLCRFAADLAPEIERWEGEGSRYIAWGIRQCREWMQKLASLLVPLF